MDYEKKEMFLNKYGLKITRSHNQSFDKLKNHKSRMIVDKYGNNIDYYKNENSDYLIIDHSTMYYNKQHKCYIIITIPYRDFEDFSDVDKFCKSQGLVYFKLNQYNYYSDSTFMFALGTTENFKKIFMDTTTK